MAEQEEEGGRQLVIERAEVANVPRGFHAYQVREAREAGGSKSRVWVVPDNIHLLGRLGSGAYGVVLHGVITDTNTEIAIKRCENVFRETSEARRYLREVKYLIRLQKQHPNIVILEDIFLVPSFKTFDEIYMAFEKCDICFATQIFNEEIVLEDRRRRWYAYQMFCCLKYLHSGRLIHRDLKPANILLQDDVVKICDFGSTRELHDVMTTAVVTLWYRAPELLLHYPNYDYAVDVWSGGVILAEMYRRKPLFPGRGDSRQMTTVFGIIGAPTPEELDKFASPAAKQFVRQMVRNAERQKFQDLIPEAPAELVELVDSILVMDPAKRPTASQVLAHPFFDPVRQLELEVEMDPDMVAGVEPSPDLNEYQIKRSTWDEICTIHPSMKSDFTAYFESDKFKEDCRVHFESADLNGDGVIDRDELHEQYSKIFKELSISIPDVEIPTKEKSDEIFDKFDANGDGVIELCEFEAFFKMCIQETVDALRMADMYVEPTDS